jgi:hypothetical protein
MTLLQLSFEKLHPCLEHNQSYMQQQGFTTRSLIQAQYVYIEIVEAERTSEVPKVNLYNPNCLSDSAFSSCRSRELSLKLILSSQSG